MYTPDRSDVREEVSDEKTPFSALAESPSFEKLPFGRRYAMSRSTWKSSAAGPNATVCTCSLP